MSCDTRCLLVKVDFSLGVQLFTCSFYNTAVVSVYVCVFVGVCACGGVHTCVLFVHVC